MHDILTKVVETGPSTYRRDRRWRMERRRLERRALARRHFAPGAYNRRSGRDRRAHQRRGEISGEEAYWRALGYRQ